MADLRMVKLMKVKMTVSWTHEFEVPETASRTEIQELAEEIAFCNPNHSRLHIVVENLPEINNG